MLLYRRMLYSSPPGQDGEVQAESSVVGWSRAKMLFTLTDRSPVSASDDFTNHGVVAPAISGTTATSLAATVTT